jgi:hypothetical protein
MTRGRRLPAALAVILLSLATLPAHAAKRPQPPLPMAADVDPDSLVGITTYGAYFDTAHLGELEVGVSSARGGGAAWSVRIDLVMSMFGSVNTISEHSVLDASFATLSVTAGSEEVEQGEVVEAETSELRLKGRKWRFEELDGGVAGGATLPYEWPNHGELGNHLMLVRSMDLQPATHHLHEVFEGEGDSGPSLAYGPVTVEVAATAPFEHRGQELLTHQVTVTDDSEAIVFAVTPDHTVLAFWPVNEAVPLRFVGGTEAECRSNLPGAESGGADERAVREAVGTLIRSMAGLCGGDELDAVMDWAALAEVAAAARGTEEVMDAQAFAAEYKVEMVPGTPEITEQDAGFVLGLMVIEVDGDEASCMLPGGDSRGFLLHRRDGRWLIYSFDE